MDTNFEFLIKEWEFLRYDAQEAEKHVNSAPVTSAFYSRRCMELCIDWLYKNEQSLSQPYQTTLSARMAEHSFKALVPVGIYKEINLIRKIGNNAVHGTKVSSVSCQAAVKFLFRFLAWVVKMYSENPPVIYEFNENLLNQESKLKEKSKLEIDLLSRKLNEALSKEFEARKKALESEEVRLMAEEKLQKVQELKQNNQPVEIPPALYTEAQTRDLIIDVNLREAGWNPDIANVREYEVIGMPKSVNKTGVGYVDYVLWDDNAKPLAVIEAKKSTVGLEVGKHQAELYANCLEQMTGQRPIIFYTNGYETELWDDVFYPPRRVHGFYTKEDLQFLISRRSVRKDLRTLSINDKITDRYYQKAAIQSVAEKFSVLVDGQLRGASRAALLVMATGTGKTRTAISLVDILFRANWIKRVLFLADRNALVTQAKRRFDQLLPSLSSIDLTQEPEDKNTRLVFSTYPTMMNKIDSAKNKDERFYTVGHFDLIIVDEAHRSVYQKYRAIFEYFDALMIGLTATPKDDADHDTYELFDEEFQVPTYNYDLETALSDNYLKPYNGKIKDLNFLSKGLKYSELSEEEKIKYEETFRDEAGNMPDFISSNAFNDWFLNKDTNDKVIHYLMTEGIKVEGGDKIGKTIIFARNHEHAVFIEKRFNKQYPQYGNKFLRVIDNYEKSAQDLIDEFSLPNRYPQIACSVDMLDTGIDIPEIVNLVFFKPVYSKSKFWQMIGRGTRTCEDLFGSGIDKEEFIIFDFCGVFDFFQENPKGKETGKTDTLSSKTFKTIIRLAEYIKQNQLNESKYQQFRNDSLDWAYNKVANLYRESFTIKLVLRTVEKFSIKSAWFVLSPSDIDVLFKDIAPLIILDDNDEAAKRFDLMMYTFELALLEQKSSIKYFETNVRTLGEKLITLTNINAVAYQKEFLNAIIKDEYWSNINIFSLEIIRINIRSLIQYIKKADRVVYESDIEDSILSERDADFYISDYKRSGSYLLKLESFVRNNKNNLVIRKLYQNVKLTSDEIKVLEDLIFNNPEIGTKNDYVNLLGEKPLISFIRSINGIDPAAVRQSFSNFINNYQLRSDQIEFVNKIVNHFVRNGMLELSELTNPPYTDINDQGIFGVFDEESQTRIIKIIQEINEIREIG